VAAMVACFGRGAGLTSPPVLDQNVRSSPSSAYLASAVKPACGARRVSQKGYYPQAHWGEVRGALVSPHARAARDAPSTRTHLQRRLRRMPHEKPSSPQRARQARQTALPLLALPQQRAQRAARRARPAAPRDHRSRARSRGSSAVERRQRTPQRAATRCPRRVPATSSPAALRSSRAQPRVAPCGGTRRLEGARVRAKLGRVGARQGGTSRFSPRLVRTFPWQPHLAASAGHARWRCRAAVDARTIAKAAAYKTPPFTLGEWLQRPRLGPAWPPAARAASPPARPPRRPPAAPPRRCLPGAPRGAAHRPARQG